MSQELEELHARPPHLTVVAGLLDQTAVVIPHTTRPAVVTRFVVLLFSLAELLLDLSEGSRRHGSGIEAGPLLGDLVLGELQDRWHGGDDTGSSFEF